MKQTIRNTDFLSKFVRDRNEAVYEFVTTGNLGKLELYCLTYGLPYQPSKPSFIAGIYKACCSIVTMPEFVKAAAREKCIAMGYSPELDPGHTMPMGF